jgi:antitoxin ParD1/3/4
MAGVRKRTFSLSEEQAEYVDAQVEGGGYASASEVVRAGLRALQERDAAVERWLREEVLAAYDEVQADPGLGIPADDVFNEIRAEHAALVKSAKRGP